ncbi:MAG TPA: mechanosensitive ion channel domain-containing protein, partial [Terriglobales bacterium]|nr:mechanosensitive ion channel domain-containing protein [Terriglobales bacterium]
MRAHQWIVTLGLLTLVLAAAVGLILTRQSAQLNSSSRTRRPPIVDEQPLTTARAMAALASGWDEQRYSRQALKLADHSVDVAFSYEMRQATEHPAPPTPESKKLFARADQAQAAVAEDQERIDRLQKQMATEKDGRARDALQQRIDLTKAKLELDQDELETVKTDLIRSGADRLSRIQRQFNRHEAMQKEYETNNPPTAIDKNRTAEGSASAIAEMSAWKSLRERAVRLQHAMEDARQVAAKLRESHKGLQSQVDMEVSNKEAITEQARSGIAATTGSDSSSSTSTARAITSLHQISVDQKDLSDLDKRIQDQDDLATAYGNWLDVVKTRQSAVLHDMLQFAMLILLVVFAVYLCNRLVDHFFVGLAVERTRLHTLRGVIRFAVQALGLAVILLMLFGVPNQLSTILGLAGAGLTVACKDFIMGFIGWFLLMGRNGLRVGDWVEIDGVVGEVVEIGLLRTVLLETGNWTDSGHPTGRKVAFVNSYAIEGHFFNFSTTGQWLWDEVQILVPASENPYPMIDAIQKMVAEQTAANVEAAEQEWQRS